jgi:hypothetical protein
MYICDEKNCTNVKSIVLDNGNEKIKLCSKHSKQCLAKILKNNKNGALKIIIPKKNSIDFKFNPSANSFISAEQKKANKIIEEIFENMWFRTKELEFLKHNQYMFE